MWNKSCSLLWLILACIPPGQSQVPCIPKNQKTIIEQVRIHVGNGQIIEEGNLLIEGQKIAYVGQEPVRSNINDAVRIQAKGMDLYPGFIALNTEVGLEEISQVKATIDKRELGNFNPNIRSMVAYNTDSKIIPTLRSNGVLVVQSTPEGGIVSGQSSVFKLDGWNWEDAVVLADDGIWLNWPQVNQQRGWWAEPERSNPNDKYKKETEAISEYFHKARAYLSGKDSALLQTHLAYESMRALWSGQKKLYVRVNEAKGMIQCVQLMEKLGIKPVLVGAADSWKIVDFLKAKSIAIILQKPHSLPSRTDEDVWQPYKTPKILQDAGILFAISQSGFWEQRNLAFQAGHTIGYGMSEEQALASIALNPAKIIGLDHRMGSIEVGKDASLFISKGKALDMRSQEIIHAWIQGCPVELDDVHKQLYRKYSKKYPSNE
ncbi:MAG: amidohydrolase family protein [Saprospiraceae bacterium]|nr:amidohydrolase family protein [Saprospiraceae bacterium]